jgi:hypothetical protein
MLRRETMIALRARHTAFRMAIEIMHPRLTPPPLPPPEVAIPVMPLPDRPYTQPQAPTWRYVLAGAAILLLVVAWVYVLAILLI